MSAYNPGVSNYTGNLANTVQPEILIRRFNDALAENLKHRALYKLEPIPGALGQNYTFTRVGRLADADDPIAPAANSDLNSGMTVGSPANVEQFSTVINKYGNTLDTNLISTSIAIDNQVYRNAKDLGINAARSMEKVCRRFLYGAYGGGTSFVTATASNVNSITIANAFGFDTIIVSGVQTAVSTTNKLPIAITNSGGTVTSVNVTNVSGGTLDKNIEWFPATLTLDANVTAAIGDTVVAINAPLQVRPSNVASPFFLTTSSIMTLQTLLTQLNNLETSSVGPFDESNLYYLIITPTGYYELYQDQTFQSAFRSLGEQDVYARAAFGVFQNMLIFKTPLCPTATKTVNVGSLNIKQCVLVGEDACIEGRYADIDKLDQLASLNVGLIEQDYDPDSGIKMMYRAPMDRAGEVVSLSWIYYGGFAQSTDSLTLTPNPAYTGSATASNRIYGRACVAQHY